MSKVKKLHFLMIYPLHTAPSQRFRFEQFFPSLESKGYSCSVNCFYDQKTFSILYAKGGKLKLAVRMLSCFLRRCSHLFTLAKFDCILIQRGAAPFGPPIFEWIIRFLYCKPIIYDFDDAIWLPPESKTPVFSRWVKAYYKVKKICRWSHTVVTGNQYLADYARRFAEKVVVIPTVVDTENHFIPIPYQQLGKQIIGWTGSHTTLPYLEALEPVLLSLQQKFDFELMVMANTPPRFKQLQSRFVPWSEATEVSALNKIDIGIMPLPEDEWTKGKCGFKAIQYMALAKPTVASAVGVNNEIIDDGVDGFLPTTTEEWEKHLSFLLQNPERGKEMGKSALLKIDQQYSLRKAADAWDCVLQVV